MVQSRINPLKKSEWGILAALLFLSLVPCVAGTVRLVELAGGATPLPLNPRVQLSPTPAVLHIASSVIYCVLGAFQFLPSIRRHFPQWHRYSGRALVFAGVVSALTGVWMTHFYTFPEALQGQLLYWVRLLLGLAMAVFIVLGLRAIINKRVSQHRAWMMRGYAIGLGAGSQVVIFLPFMLTMGEPAGVARDTLMVLAWVINLLIAEWIIRLPARRAHLAKA